MAQVDGVPGNLFRGNVLGQQVFSYCQFAWPLFIAEPDGPEAVNALADGYEVSADGVTHTITLRAGLTFHDGAPIDAEAVVKNLRADFFEDAPLRDEGTYSAAQLSFGSGSVVNSIDASDELTVQMLLNEPRADIRRGLWYLYIMNPEVLKRSDYGTDTGALHDAGSGPFRITNFSPSQFIEFERFDGFFQDVYLDRLRIEVITDDASMALALRSGDIDVAIAVGKEHFDQLSADPSYQALVAPRAGLNMFFDIQSPRIAAVGDPRVREAIVLALNRAAYREAFYPTGTAQPDTQPVVLPGSVGYNANLEERPYDPERARQLLAEAGVDNLTLSAIGSSSWESQFFEAVRADLEAVGIRLDINITDDATADAEWPNNDLRFDIFDDEYEFLVFPVYYQLYNTNPETDPRALNPEVERLLAAAAQSSDPSEADGSLQRLQQLEHDELVMAIPVAVIHKSAIARRGVHDLRVHLSADPLHTTWIET